MGARIYGSAAGPSSDSAPGGTGPAPVRRHFRAGSALLSCAAVNVRVLALAPLLAATVVSACLAATPVVPTLPVSALRPGQHATVRTVFQGDSVETFDADIVGVMAGGRADGEIILARATSARVESCGVAAGMSGSPVYVDGKLIGALSMGWPFSREPIFGITPIGEMLQVLDQPETGVPGGTAGPAGVDPGVAPAYRGLEWPRDSVAVTSSADIAGMPRRLPIPLAAGGLSPEAMVLAGPMFRDAGFLLTPGGRTAPTAAPPKDPLQPGSAVAVDVLRGDLNFSAIGTVTYRDGDRVLIFGHPFFQSGEVRLPLSTAHIVTILPSLYDSFKMGTPGEPVGVATQDRRPAVAGRLGGAPALMPFGVDVRRAGVAPQRFRFEVVQDRLMMPQLVATAAMSSLMESGGSGVQQTIDWALTLWKDGRAIRLGDAVAGDAPLAEVIGAITGPVHFLTGSSFERWTPDSLTIALDVTPGRRQWFVRSASLETPRVRPGGTVRIRVETELWRGPRRTTTIDVPVPAELPNGHYPLWVGGGAEFDRFIAARLPGRFRPVSVPDAIRRMERLHRSDALWAGLWARSPEVTRDGEDYPELPNSALALLSPAGGTGDRGRGDWALMAERSSAVPGVLRGETALDVIVDDRAPGRPEER
jgi:hypothetical protein